MSGLKIRSKDNQIIPLRCLMVNDKEIYRIETNTFGPTYGYLKYAKGKINFNLNLPKDGSGNTIYRLVEWNVPKSVFAFCGEGFYKDKVTIYSGYWNRTYEWCKYQLDEELGLSSFVVGEPVGLWIGGENNNRYSVGGKPTGYLEEWCPFKGWYLSPQEKEGKLEHPIKTIEDVYKYTDLFKWKKEQKLPEITLYGRWEVPTYNLVVRNISRTYTNLKTNKSYTGYSSFKVTENGKKVLKKGNAANFEDTRIYFRNVPYGTNIEKEYLSKITDFKYDTWCNSALNGTTKEQELKNNPQKFLGWSTKNSATELSWKKGTYMTIEGAARKAKNEDSYQKGETITIYPQFTPIFILKRHKFPSKTAYYYGDNAKKHYVTNVGGHYYLVPDSMSAPGYSEQPYPWPVQIGSINPPYFKSSSEKFEYFTLVKKNGKVVKYKDSWGTEWDDEYFYRWKKEASDAGSSNYIPLSSTIVCSLKKIDKRSSGKY